MKSGPGIMDGNVWKGFISPRICLREHDLKIAGGSHHLTQVLQLKSICCVQSSNQLCYYNLFLFTKLMDDFDLGASVWESTAEPNDRLGTGGKAGPSFIIQPSLLQADDGGAAFDDDDFNFDAPSAAAVNNRDDDFGDFGDFGVALQEASSSTFVQSPSFDEDGGFFAPQGIDWDGLQLNPVPSHRELRNEIEEILRPLWDSVDSSEYLTDENIRQMAGLSQILVTSERSNLFIPEKAELLTPKQSDTL